MNYLVDKSIDGKVIVLTHTKIKKAVTEYYEEYKLERITVNDDELQSDILTVLPFKSDINIFHPTNCSILSNSYYYNTKGYTVFSAFFQEDGTPSISIYRGNNVVEDFHYYYESKNTEKMIILLDKKTKENTISENKIGLCIQVLLVEKGDTVEVIRFKDSDDVYILNGDDILDIETFEAIDNKGEEYEII